MKTRTIAVSSILAALYVVLVVGLAPISFLPVQVRVADALIPLSMIFGMPAVYGLTIGCALANYISGTIFFGAASILDIVGGSFANFLACYVGWRLGKNCRATHAFLITLLQTTIITSIVGSYLWFLIGAPDIFELYGVKMPGILATMLGVAIGSIISINILGFILRESIKRFIPSNG